MTKTRLLFVTRNWPPQVGGMERYSYDLYCVLSENLTVDLLKHAGKKLTLPLFAARCVFYLLFRGRNYTHIHFCDAVLAPLAWLAKKFTGAKVSSTVHALDVVYANSMYQFIVPRCLTNLDRIIAVSQYTLEQCVQRGVNRERCRVIPNGIDSREMNMPIPAMEVVARKYNIDIAGRKVLFSVGRLIKRKGIRWFIEQVIPLLDAKYLYLVAGHGPEYDAMVAAIRDNNLGDRVRLLGRISDPEKLCLYRNAELFIMPNIIVPGDAEGFGITLLEAAACGLPVIASSIEGIPDAVIDGVTGTLVEPLNREKYTKAITDAGFDRAEVAKAARNRYDWSVLKKNYIREVFS